MPEPGTDDGAADPAGSPGVCLATYNLHLGGARVAAERLAAHWLPDLLCLQETRDPAGFVAAGTGAPRHIVWQPVPGMTWGSALLVRAESAIALTLPPDLAGWVVAAEIPGGIGLGSRPLRAYSVHAPAQPRGSYTRMVEYLLDVVATDAGGADVVLGGDFNVVTGRRGPDEPVRMTRAETAILDRLEGALGLRACWQAAHPGQPLARTLRWRHQADSLPFHCDGLFVPAAWLPALQDCTILTAPPWDTASDHHPVVATFAAAALTL